MKIQIGEHWTIYICRMLTPLVLFGIWYQKDDMQLVKGFSIQPFNWYLQKDTKDTIIHHWGILH